MEDSAQYSRQAESKAREPRPWTVMVYMVAEKDTDLDAVAVHDLREMERGANEHAHVVVQMKRAWPAEPQRFAIGERAFFGCLSDTAAVKTPKVIEMDQAETLRAFLSWAKNAFPADHYCLVLWGHAYGVGFGRSHNEPLTLKAIKDALDAFARGVGKDGKSGHKLDLLGANACAMAYAEAAYEFRDSAHFMMASQLAVPYAGWPYETIPRGITEKTKPEDLGHLIAETYVTFYDSLPSGGRASMSLLNLEAAAGIGPAVEKLAGALTHAIQPKGRFIADRQAMLRDVFVAAAAGDVRPLLDLEDLCRDLGNVCMDSVETVTTATKEEITAQLALVKTAAVEVRNCLRNVVRYPVLPIKLDDELDAASDELHGLGIYAPFVTDDVDLDRLQMRDEEGRRAYRELAIFQPPEQGAAQDNQGETAGKTGAAWPELVYHGLRREIDADLVQSLSSIGATYGEDRRNAIQIAISIDASFNKFDRAVGEARKAAVEPMKQKARAPNASKTQRFDSQALKILRLATSSQPTRAQSVDVRDAILFAAAAAAVAVAAKVVTSSPQGHDDTVQRHLNDFVPQFKRLEKALGEVERAVLSGLTHDKLGLGPIAGNGLGEPPKTGELGPEPPKTGTLGSEPPKTGTLGDGVTGLTLLQSSPGGDLRFDLAVARVAKLFGEVGSALARLENVTSDVEKNIAPLVEAASSADGDVTEVVNDLEREFAILHEASSSARRTVRRVLLHPVYGLGPGTAIARSERQALARAGGLDRLSLRLM